MARTRTRREVSKPDPPVTVTTKKRKKAAAPTDSEAFEAVRSVSGRFSYALWSEAEEMRILQGLLEIKEKKGGLLPTFTAAARELYGVMKDSLPTNVTENAFLDKPRKMKLKFRKIHTRGFWNAAEKPFYELAFKLWGAELAQISSTESGTSGASALAELILYDKEVTPGSLGEDGVREAWASLDLKTMEKFELRWEKWRLNSLQMILDQGKALYSVGKKLSRKKQH